MRVYVSSKDLEYARLTHQGEALDFRSIEEHDAQIKEEAFQEYEQRLLHYKDQMVDDIGLCASATLIDYFKHIREEIHEDNGSI